MASEQPSAVVLDDDLTSMREISQALRKKYTVLATGDLRRAMTWLENDKSVTIFILNQAFKPAIWLHVLQQVRELRPNITRVLRTPYSDLEDIVPGLHNGDISFLVSKPLSAGEIQSLIGATRAA